MAVLPWASAYAGAWLGVTGCVLVEFGWWPRHRMRDCEEADHPPAGGEQDLAAHRR